MWLDKLARNFCKYFGQSEAACSKNTCKTLLIFEADRQVKMEDHFRYEASS